MRRWRLWVGDEKRLLKAHWRMEGNYALLLVNLDRALRKVTGGSQTQEFEEHRGE